VRGPILVLNAGSSSIKAAIFDRNDAVLAEGTADAIGADRAAIRVAGARTARPLPDHAAALDALLAALPTGNLGGVGHRVVHGGTALTAPARIDARVLAGIEAAAPLAPLHNPPALAAIGALERRAPGLPQVACFDTAFHATIPLEHARFALPDTPETAGLRRYGFHGISYQGLIEALPAIMGAPLPERVLACHLGNGASLCAIRAGRSVATTMGYAPLDGLTMGTRSGAVDPAAVLELARRVGIDAAERLLTRESGLKGLSGGRSDMRTLLDAGDAAATFARDHFVASVVRHAGAMVAAMGGLDAVAFTGGIGENAAPIRGRIIAGLAHLGLAPRDGRHDRTAGRATAWVVPAREEATIARLTRGVLAE